MVAGRQRREAEVQDGLLGARVDEDAIRSGEIQLVINTPIGRQAAHDDRYLRRAALDYAVPTVTTLAGARAAVEGIAALQQRREVEVIALQDIYGPWGG